MTNIQVKSSEHSEQASFFDWLYNFKLREHPEIQPLFFSVPNGAYLSGNGKQRAMQMHKLRGEGLMPGVSDTLFLSGRGGYLGLAMEFKTPDRKSEKNGGLSEAQQEFLRSGRTEGYLAVCAYGAEDAAFVANNYFAMPKTQNMVWAALRAADGGDLESCKHILQAIVRTW